MPPFWCNEPMIAAILIALVRVYQLTLSKLLLWTVGPVCRFEPSCSRYAVACLRDHGALRGSLLSAKRLCRCHPFHPGGYDPPPPAPTKGTKTGETSSGGSTRISQHPLSRVESAHLPRVTSSPDEVAASLRIPAIHRDSARST